MHVLRIFILLITISKILAVPEANCSSYYLLIEESMFSFDPVAVDDADLNDLDPHIPRQCYLNLMCGPTSETNCVDTVKSNPKRGNDVIIRDPLNPIPPTTLTTHEPTTLKPTIATTNGTTALKPTTGTTNETTALEQTAVTTNETAPLKPITVTTNGTAPLEPTSVITNGTTPLEPTAVNTNGTTPLEPTAVNTNGTTPLEPPTFTTNGTSSEPTIVTTNGTTTPKPAGGTSNQTTILEPSTVTTNETTSLESTTVTTNGTTPLEPPTVNINKTTTTEPAGVTSNETTTPDTAGVTSNETTTPKPIAVATNETTTQEPTTIINNGTSPIEPTAVSTNKTTPLEPTTVANNVTVTLESTTVFAYATTTLKPIITTYKITKLQPEVAYEDEDRESLLPERCNKKFKQYILNSDCGERIDRNYKSTVFYQCDTVPYKECTGHDVDEDRLHNLTRVSEHDEAYKNCQHYLIHTKLYDLDGQILYHPLNLLTAKLEDIPCADYNATCILKFECTNIGEYCIRTYRYQRTQPEQKVTRSCFTKKTSITDAPSFKLTTPTNTATAVSTTTAKTIESQDNTDENIFSAFIRRKPTEDLIILFAFLAIGQLALTILIYVIVTRIKRKRESDRYEVEASSNDKTLRQIPPANIF